ncbi:MAG: sulfatase [Planctomycetales bacterium]|nr:sulfatase [Planctomycetales bacterium]
MNHSFRTLAAIAIVSLLAAVAPASDVRPNIVFVLCDDHRWDAMGNMGHPFLETPHLDRMVKRGVRFDNSYVTTSLCSPSRASILTGMYTHNHGVADNYHPVDASLKFFPEYLQTAGYETAFIGKWHMGDLDDPQRGFDHWVAFRGQGTYYPDGHGTSRVVPQTRYDGFNINGERRVAQERYITDELTDYALDWLKQRTGDNPFFLYVSHKAVHSDFVPRDKDRDKYKSKQWTPPPTFGNSAENKKGKPRWLIDQRNSRHGVDYGYNLDNFEVEHYYKRYCEALTAVDDNVGRMMEYLEATGQLDNTLVIYMGDNGFQFGEHGLIDKRTAYEASIRVPLVMQYPAKLQSGTKLKSIVANIDIGPTILEVAGVAKPKQMDGDSFWQLALGNEIAWRDSLLYEYYWEWNYPQTPTVFALIGGRYKFIRYHGVWDTDELYDVENDPDEKDNLIRSADHKEVVATMKKKLFERLQATNGLRVPMLPDRGRQFFNRHRDRSDPGKFPEWYYDEMVPITK